MRKIIIAALLTAALCLIPAPVFAQNVRDDGNEWLSKCNDDSYTYQGWCVGYTQALSHGYDVMALMTGKQSYCQGSRYVTMGQMRDMIRAYLNRNPAKRSDVMMLIYINTMKEAFPC